MLFLGLGECTIVAKSDNSSLFSSIFIAFFFFSCPALILLCRICGMSYNLSFSLSFFFFK